MANALLTLFVLGVSAAFAFETRSSHRLSAQGRERKRARGTRHGPGFGRRATACGTMVCLATLGAHEVPLQLNLGV